MKDHVKETCTILMYERGQHICSNSVECTSLELFLKTEDQTPLLAQNLVQPVLNSNALSRAPESCRKLAS